MKNLLRVSLFSLVATFFWTDLASAQITDTTIANAKRDVDGDGCPDDLISPYRVTGRVTTPDFVGFESGATQYEIYIQDTNDNAAIRIYFPILGDPDFNPAPFVPGVEVTVAGFIEQHSGVRDIMPTIPSFQMTVSDPTVIPVTPLTMDISSLLAAGESMEGTLVTITNVTLSGNWPALGSSGNPSMNDGTGTLTLRVDRDTDQDGQLMLTNVVSVTGIFTQFNTVDDCPLDGYQLLSRSFSDVVDLIPQPPSISRSPDFPLYSAAPGLPLNIQFVGADPNSLDVLTFDLATNPGGASLTEVETRTQEFVWVPGINDGGTTNDFVITVTDGTSTATSSFQVVVLPQELAGILLNEIHFDPAAGSAGDANGDGTRSSSSDEFIEIVNTGAGTVNMSGWVIEASGAPRFTFPPGTLVTSETAVVIFHGGTPVGNFGFAQVFIAPDMFLSNSGTAIRLLTDTQVQVFSIDYREVNGFFGGNPNESLNRSPDLGQDWDVHSSQSAALWSPGTQPNGLPYPGTGISNSPPVFNTPNAVVAQIGDQLVLDILATDIDMDSLSYRATNLPPTAIFTDANNGMALLEYTGQAADAGTSFVITLTVSDGFNPPTSKDLRLDVPDAIYTGLRINEFMSDPSGGGYNHDSNRDGTGQFSQDEFVEMVNGGTNLIELSGLELWDGDSRKHLFGSWRMAADSAYVVFGGGSTSNFTASGAAVASSGSLVLNNGGDDIRLFSPGGQLIDQLSYSSSGPLVPGDAASTSKIPDITGDFANHWEFFNFTGDINRASPGLRINQSPFATSPQGAPDDDGDGIPNDYEIANGLNPNEDGTVGESSPGAKDGPDGALGDKDLDGVNNFDEFVALTDADDILSFNRLRPLHLMRMNQSTTVMIPQSSSAREYFLESRNAPGDASWTPGAVEAGTDGVLILEDLTSEAGRVYRLGIRIPAAP